MERIEDLRILIDRIPFAEGNIGEEAILASLLQDLSSCGVRDITVLSNQPERTKQRHGDRIKVIPDNKKNWLTLPFKIKRYDLLIWGGGHMLQDRSSQLYIPYVTKTLLLAKLSGVPRFIYAPGLGPVVNRFGRLLSKFALAGSQVLIVRDEESLDFLRGIKLKQHVEVTGDPGFSFNTRYDDANAQNSNTPVIGFAPRRLFYRRGSWLPVSWQLSSQRMVNSRLERFFQEAAAGLDLLVEKHDAEIRFLPLDLGPNPRDDLVCHRIHDYMVHKRKAKVYDDDPPLEEFIRRLSELHLLVSARLHGIILGLRYGLPFIGIDSDGKIPRLADLVGMNEYVIDDHDFNRDIFFAAAMKIIENQTELRNDLKTNSLKLVEKANHNFELLDGYLESIISEMESN